MTFVARINGVRNDEATVGPNVEVFRMTQKCSAVVDVRDDKTVVTCGNRAAQVHVRGDRLDLGFFEERNNGVQAMLGRRAVHVERVAAHR